MTKYTYTGTQPYTATLNGQDVLLGKGDETELDETLATVKYMVAAGSLVEVKPAGNNTHKLEKTKP